MIIDGVNFNEEVVRQMDENEFIEKHVHHFWKDKDEETRVKKLRQAYELIAVKPAGTRRRRTES